MENITFCIPYYGKTIDHTYLLSTCITKIREFYPTNDIIVCKTLNSYLPIMINFTNVHVIHLLMEAILSVRLNALFVNVKHQIM